MNNENKFLKIINSKTINDFKKNLKDYPCKNCSLSHKGKHYPIISRGNEKAKIILVGEAPGAAEIKIGLPFIGKSGKLLDSILNNIGISINKYIYISNICRCRPPNNRMPKEIEAKTCIQYLNKEIELLKPNFIMAMGATSVKHLLGKELSKKKMSENVGKYFPLPNNKEIIVFILYHPAALIYNPKLKSVLINHLKLFYMKNKEIFL